MGLEVDEAVCINKVITGILLGNFLLCFTFFVVAGMTVRRLWRRVIVLDKCSVVNIDMCPSFTLEHGIGSREMWSLHELGSAGKPKKFKGGLIDSTDCISDSFK